MINLILTKKTVDFQEIFHYYQSAFPPEERRTKENFLALTENENVEIGFANYEGKNIGYFVIWEIEDYFFLEHFEVFPSFRNLGLGSTILTELQLRYKIIFLESEPPHLSLDAKRRIDFYLKNGFSILEDNYLQPNYISDAKPVAMFLLCNYFSTEEIDRIWLDYYINRIKSMVYAK